MTGPSTWLWLKRPKSSNAHWSACNPCHSHQLTKDVLQRAAGLIPRGWGGHPRGSDPQPPKKQLRAQIPQTRTDWQMCLQSLAVAPPSQCTCLPRAHCVGTCTCEVRETTKRSKSRGTSSELAALSHHGPQGPTGWQAALGLRTQQTNILVAEAQTSARLAQQCATRCFALPSCASLSLLTLSLRGLACRSTRQ